MHHYIFPDYDLLLGQNACEIFTHLGVTELHGLSLKECREFHNTPKSAYIAGWCNLLPASHRPFVFINLQRCTEPVRTTGLVMHEMSHLFWLLNYDNLKEKEEEIIANAEEEAYRVVEIIQRLKSNGSY